jgi:hypothetical protein
MGFFAGEASDVGDGVFVGERVLGDVSRMDGEKVAGLGEEFAAAGRGGGEDEHVLIMAGAGNREQRTGNREQRREKREERRGQAG